MNIEGVVSLACYVSADGAVRDCVVRSEDPPGYGFGATALQLATLFKMKPATRDGQPIDSPTPIIIPVQFRLPVRGAEAAHRLADSVKDPRVQAWVSRIVVAGRTVTASCDDRLERDGFDTLLQPEALAADEDLSKAAAIAKMAFQHATDDCVREEKAWREAALSDLGGLGLPADQQKIVADVFDRSLKQYREQVSNDRIIEARQALELVEFLRANGASWRATFPGRGFVFPNKTVAARAKNLQAKADASRQALLDEESSAP